MNCPDEGMLQAYIDKELTYDENKYIDIHLLECASCREKLRQITENNTFAMNRIKEYKKSIDSLTDIEIKPFKPEKETFLDFINRGVELIMYKYKPAAAAIISAALIVTCVAVQPVRAAVSNALSIFRVDNVKSVNISLDEIRQIEDEIQNHKSEINMDKLGKVTTTGGQKEFLTLEKSKTITDFKPLFLPEEYNINLSINSIDPTSINFNLNVDNVNDVLKSLGAKKLLPQSLNGKTFTVNIPRELNLQYIINGRSYNIIETKTPEILAPEDVNTDEIYNSLVDLPIIPADLQRQLKSIKDWKSTMYIPFVKSSMEEVNINGNKGYATDINSLNSKAKSSDTHNEAVLWYKDGVFYGIQGPGSKDDLIKLAEAMR